MTQVLQISYSRCAVLYLFPLISKHEVLATCSLSRTEQLNTVNSVGNDSITLPYYYYHLLRGKKEKKKAIEEGNLKPYGSTI